MHINVVAIGVEAVIEDERSAHERTGVYERSTLSDHHLLQVQDEHSVEDLSGDAVLASENDDFAG